MSTEQDAAPAGVVAGDSKGADNDTSDGVASIRAEVDRRDKQIANLKARAALACYQLHVIDAGSIATFVIVRWGMQRELPCVAEVERFLEQVGGAP